jgi:HAE1 family hydrophobic/amphiphilic exporter-1
VVRENIFRKLEGNMPPDEAAVKGTNEVMMAVIATTITIMSVFLPIAFMSGIVGRFFKQFGFTVVFAMAVSLFDALTVAPLLSSYFSGRAHKKTNFIISSFEKFQCAIDSFYSRTLKKAIAHPLYTLIIALLVFGVSIASVSKVKKAFIPANDDREFKLTITMPSGTSLTGTQDASDKVGAALQSVTELEHYALLVGAGEGKSNIANFFIKLTPEKTRTRTNEQVKSALRKTLLEKYADYKPVVSEYSSTGDPHPFALNISGSDLEQMNEYSKTLIDELKKMKDLSDVNSAYESSKPEYQVVLDQEKMARLGITPGIAGAELRYHIAGEKVGTLHDRGNEYDVRLRLRPDQRDIKNGYALTKIPNLNGKMVPLSAIGSLKEKTAPNQILRQDRKRIIQITANIAPGGALGTAADKTEKLYKGSLKPPAGVNIELVGEKNDMDDLGRNILMAVALSIIIVFLVLSSLYGSFITPFTILCAIPPAISGALLALFLTGKTLDIFSQIGLVMLIGLVTKNSILLVDYAVKGVASGMSRQDAIFQAGMTRLRPILMTTFAMIAGTLPVALGIGEAARGRMSMGVAIIGGVILSTALTLIVVPAVFSFIDRVREKIETPFGLDAVKKRLGFIKEAPKQKKK